MKTLLSMVGAMLFVATFGQTYFPPATGSEWETLNPDSLNWCPEKIDTLLSFLEDRNSKAFMILKDGKIVLENYFNGHSQNAFWFWASAGKTIAATLAGKALEDGLLQLDDPVSQYLGTGWTSCDSIDEYQRTVYHQLSMSSSFSIMPLFLDCTEPSCFECNGQDAGTEWHYHNGVYRQLMEVIETSTGETRNAYTNSVLEEATGMSGFWTDNLYWSRHRDMARFGWLVLNGFQWDGAPVLTDQDYISSLTAPSQPMNPAYGYLWWLNGQESYHLPLDPVEYQGSMIPSGPDDMYMALGAEDQKVYVVPSQGLVVTRQGDAAYDDAPAVTSFDEELWQLLSDLECFPLSASKEDRTRPPTVFPNPSSGRLHLANDELIEKISVYTVDGRLIDRYGTVESLSLPKGIFVLSISRTDGIVLREKVIVQ